MPCYYPMRIRNPKPSAKNPTEFIDIPCGKCFQCLQRKRNEWVYRMQYEMKKYYTKSWFATFTYDDEHLPPHGADKEFCKRFLKQIRERYPGVKYFFVTEYGPTTGRIHAHAVFFNTTIDHYEIVHYLNKYWKNGLVKVELVTLERLGYVAGYEITRNEVPEGQNPNFRLISQGMGKPVGDELDFIPKLNKTGIRRSDGKLTPVPRYTLDKVCNETEKYCIQKKKQRKAQKMFETETRTFYQLENLRTWK